MKSSLARSARTALTVLFAVLPVALPAGAQTWPSKPVRLVNPFAAGGGTDVFARPIAAKLSQQMGQQFVIENQGGAGGTLGAANAARAPADGYTVLVGAVHHTIAESVYSKLPYNLERDFVPVTMLAVVPQIIVMHPKSAAKTLPELIALARDNPGKLSFGSAGNGTAHHLAGELFKVLTKTDLTHVPYRGAGPMMQDLLAGQIDMAFDGLGTSAAQIKGGKLRPIAVAANKRSPVLSDIPTATEAGLPNFVVSTWYGLWFPRGTPQAAIDRLYTETAKALQLADIRDIWAAQGADAGGMPPPEFAKFVSSEIAKWARVAKESNLKIDL